MSFRRHWMLGSIIYREYLPFSITKYFFGEKGKDWKPYESDADWLKLQLLTRIN